jgi:hypothetical protein
MEPYGTPFPAWAAQPPLALCAHMLHEEKARAGACAVAETPRRSPALSGQSGERPAGFPSDCAARPSRARSAACLAALA